MRKLIKVANLPSKDGLLRFLYNFCLTRRGRILRILKATMGGLLLWSGGAIAGVPNGTWLSQPQIRFYSSNNILDQAMVDIKSQGYKVVFLDFRGVGDEVQQQVSEKAREQRLIPVVWIQSPQYRSLTVAEMIRAARYGDGIQVDDHFFAHYSPREFQSLYLQYKKFIFCSIQPFQAALVPQYGCNQLDVQCYTIRNFQSCLKLAARLNAVVSLSEQNTFRYRDQLGMRPFNVFLWPYTNRRWGTGSQNSFDVRDLVSHFYLPFHLFKMRN